MHRLAEDMGNKFGLWSPPPLATPPPLPRPYGRPQAFSDPYLTQQPPFAFSPPPPHLPQVRINNILIRYLNVTWIPYTQHASDFQYSLDQN